MALFFWLKASFEFGLENVSTFARGIADVFGFCGFVYNTIINLHIFFRSFSMTAQ